MELHTGLNNLDYIVLGTILLSGLLALMRGFVREMFSLVAWAGAYFVAAKYYSLAEPWAHRYIKNPSTAADAAAIAVFCIAFVVLAVAGFVIARLIKGRALTAIDRSLGFVFGLLRGAFLVCLLYLGAVSILWPDVDKPLPPPVPIVVPIAPGTPPTQTADKDKNKEKDKEPAPPWLMEAKTRPFMAYGAEQLHALIPEKDIERTTQKYREEKIDAQHIIDQQTINALTNENVEKKPTPGYDDKNRDNMNKLIDQKAKP